MDKTSKFSPPAYYLPHQTPMLWLEQIHQIDEHSVLSSVSTHADALLAPWLQQGEFPSHLLLEIMAQNIGVWSGYWRIQQGKPQPPLGLLLGTRAFSVVAPTVPAATTFFIESKLLMSDDKFSSFQCRILLGSAHGDEFAQARLTTYLPEPSQLQQLFANE